MKHYRQMTDAELGDLVFRSSSAMDEATMGRAMRRVLDSMEPDELAEVRAEVDRTARAVTAMAAAEGARYGQPGWTSLDREVAMLERLRVRQGDLEVAQRTAAKGGE